MCVCVSGDSMCCTKNILRYFPRVPPETVPFSCKSPTQEQRCELITNHTELWLCLCTLTSGANRFTRGQSWGQLQDLVSPLMTPKMLRSHCWDSLLRHTWEVKQHQHCVMQHQKGFYWERKSGILLISEPTQCETTSRKMFITEVSGHMISH